MRNQFYPAPLAKLSGLEEKVHSQHREFNRPGGGKVSVGNTGLRLSGENGKSQHGHQRNWEIYAEVLKDFWVT